MQEDGFLNIPPLPQCLARTNFFVHIRMCICALVCVWLKAVQSATGFQRWFAAIRTRTSQCCKASIEGRALKILACGQDLGSALSSYTSLLLVTDEKHFCKTSLRLSERNGHLDPPKGRVEFMDDSKILDEDYR